MNNGMSKTLNTTLNILLAVTALAVCYVLILDDGNEKHLYISLGVFFLLLAVRSVYLRKAGKSQ
jgi:hypothetical protein